MLFSTDGIFCSLSDNQINKQHGRTVGRGRGSITRHRSERALISFRLSHSVSSRGPDIHASGRAGRTGATGGGLAGLLLPRPISSVSPAAQQPSALALWRKQLGCRRCTQRRDAVWVLIQCLDLVHLNHNLHQPSASNFKQINSFLFK